MGYVSHRSIGVPPKCCLRGGGANGARGIEPRSKSEDFATVTINPHVRLPVVGRCGSSRASPAQFSLRRCAVLSGHCRAHSARAGQYIQWIVCHERLPPAVASRCRDARAYNAESFDTPRARGVGPVRRSTCSLSSSCSGHCPRTSRRVRGKCSRLWCFACLCLSAICIGPRRRSICFLSLAHSRSYDATGRRHMSRSAWCWAAHFSRDSTTCSSLPVCL